MFLPWWKCQPGLQKKVEQFFEKNVSIKRWKENKARPKKSKKLMRSVAYVKTSPLGIAN